MRREKLFEHRSGAMLALVALFVLGGCASTGTAEGDDPLEPFNRAMYAIHEPVETYAMRPATEVYETVVPKPGRKGISNFFRNIDDFTSAISGLLQGKFEAAGHDLGRVVINTSFGLGGIIDFASDADIPRGDQDFGLVLAHWGVGPQPYLFLPLLGPTTLRDGFGSVAQAYASPLKYAVDDNIPLRNTLWGVGTMNSMAAGVNASKALDGVGMDRYTVIRSAYLQRRAYLSGDTTFGRIKLDDDEDYDDGYSTPPSNDTPQDDASTPSPEPSQDKKDATNE